MKAQRFNGLMPRINEKWAASVLNMELNLPNTGPDLSDELKHVEVKFSLVDALEKYPKSWTVQEHQMGYNNSKPCYWALALYRLRMPVGRISEGDIQRLDKLVTTRNLYIVTWDWMKQYPPHDVYGYSRKSGHWHNTFRYPKFDDLPKIIDSHKVRKGVVHLTEGVPEKEFLIGVPF